MPKKNKKRKEKAIVLLEEVTLDNILPGFPEDFKIWEDFGNIDIIPDYMENLKAEEWKLKFKNEKNV